MAIAIMVQGTASDVGKSWICTGLCRLLARRGRSVVPFKAQNMSNNAAPAAGPPGGGEIGRSQAVQAEAAGLAPHVDMNPILLKPSGPLGSQVVVLGEAVGHQRATSYQARRAIWWSAITGAYARLAAAHDVVVIEGAGSPSEFNLRASDLANMEIALHAQASVLLVGDIERGGVFASLLGTLALLSPAERALVRGLVINRFRGEPALLRSAVEPFAARAGVPVRGVLPWLKGAPIDAEDGQQIRAGGAVDPGSLDLCAIRTPTISNFTDLEAIGRAPGVVARYVRDPAQVGSPDLLVLPGSKDTIADLAWLRRVGMDRVIRAAADRGIPILGLCGGYQILGERLRDAPGLAGVSGDVEGLGLLPIQTRFDAEKRTRAVRGETLGGWLLPAGLPVEGYEIHQGRSDAGGAPLVALGGGPDGAVRGAVAGCYVHGLLDRPEIQRALIDALWSRRGLAPIARPGLEAPATIRARAYDAIADQLEAHLDLSFLGL